MQVKFVFFQVSSVMETYFVFQDPACFLFLPIKFPTVKLLYNILFLLIINRRTKAK